MREIRFRAWHKKRNKFYEVMHLMKDSWNNLWAKCRGYDVIDDKDITIDIQPNDCIIMQYTGLKDKNGVEIYEGDIIKCLMYVAGYDRDDEANRKYRICEVKSGCPCHVHPSGIYIFDIDGKRVVQAEVIGNIYEDSHFLEEANGGN